ncbi:hypothetical protein ACIRRA_24045 [Nocardia sp. NPDC101769]|uniref:hypothetical protein n=1 Tax=Nocardia sp. NPDC101769 TaxID=3364333 RepID=UPI0037F18948
MHPARTNGTVLKALLRERGWHRYDSFAREYSRIAAELGVDGYPPEPRTFRRWLGRMDDLPRRYYRRVLEAMLPGYTIEELFAPFDLLGGAPLPAPNAVAIRKTELVRLMAWMSAEAVA